ISLVGTGAGLAGIAGSLLSGDNKTTTTTTTKEGAATDGSIAGVAKTDVDDAIKRLIQTQIDAINQNKGLSSDLSKTLKDQIAGLSSYYGNAKSKYDPSKNVLSSGGGGTGGTSYVGGAGLSEKASAALEEIMGVQLANLKNAGKLTPEQGALIDAQTGLALQTGQSDITKFTQDTLRQINEEISQASGLRPTDTPIVRLSERAGEEASRQQGQLVRTLAGANVQSKLDYPLKASANTGALAASASSTNEALRAFQADLEQRAENNRYRLFGQPMQDPYANNASGNLGLSLAQLQLGQSPTTQTQTQSLGLNDYVNAASGIGALIKSLYLMNP
ncbi:MAG: hypothetical protein NUV34_02980, partial [Sulfuricaulis sp.]|nr:hypothetical protein [Sulfuricaulis sp.]